ncbi:MAG TPA: DUF3052 domain-containing protein [Chthoniobacterales bacterium]|jgi:hypothetical protein
MAGYSGTPLWKKLGYKSDLRTYVDDPPQNYRKLLRLPKDVRVIWEREPGPGLRLVHLFARDARVVRTKLSFYRKQIAPEGVIWLSWPKKSSGMRSDVTEDYIREVAIPLGLVDVKVCAVDEIWSGLKLMIRRELRR